MPTTFTYEVVLRVHVTEDNPDMPSTNINTFGQDIARAAESLWDSDDVVVHLYETALLDSKRKR
jgi:hypothetical protein